MTTNTEIDMADCPKCNAPMHIDGDKLVCSNLTCTYQRAFMCKVPSQAALLRELEEIKKRSYYISSDTWESDIDRIIYNLRRKPGGLGVMPGTLYFAPDP